jgi:hypothetical protein
VCTVSPERVLLIATTRFFILLSIVQEDFTEMQLIIVDLCTGSPNFT